MVNEKQTDRESIKSGSTKAKSLLMSQNILQLPTSPLSFMKSENTCSRTMKSPRSSDRRNIKEFIAVQNHEKMQLKKMDQRKLSQKEV